MNDKQQNLKSKESNIMANKILQGTVDYYIRGQYGILKGDDGKEYCFGRKAVGDRSKLVNGDVVKFTVDQNHPILVSKVTSYVAVKSRLIKSLAKKGYGFQIEKDGKWNILVRHGDKKSNVNKKKSNVKNDDCKIGGHVVPDDIPVKKSLEEAASEADVKVDTEIIHVHRYFA